MIGQSKAHKRLVEEINLVGGSDLTVLITGETGVGKELVAQAIHAASPRRQTADQPQLRRPARHPGGKRTVRPCARRLYRRLSERRGKFELANGGTLFLDEVGELSLTVQAKLLRVLQSGQLQRLGSDKEHQVDVRLIAATNRDLAEEVRSGRYRADFYHRLSVYPLQYRRCAIAGAMCCCSAATFWNRTARAWASTACA
jgi:anaerobic nitric oxide reductase transcription regulator